MATMSGEMAAHEDTTTCPEVDELKADGAIDWINNCRKDSAEESDSRNTDCILLFMERDNILNNDKTLEKLHSNRHRIDEELRKCKAKLFSASVHVAQHKQNG